MLVKRTWSSKSGRQSLLGFVPKYFYTGYFILGIIPIFINRELNS